MATYPMSLAVQLELHTLQQEERCLERLLVIQKLSDHPEAIVTLTHGPYWEADAETSEGTFHYYLYNGRWHHA